MLTTLPAVILNASRERLIELVQRCDPNGCWTDELGAAEGFDPIRKADLLDMLSDGEHDDMVAWVAERL